MAVSSTSPYALCHMGIQQDHRDLVSHDTAQPSSLKLATYNAINTAQLISKEIP